MVQPRHPSDPTNGSPPGRYRGLRPRRRPDPHRLRREARARPAAGARRTRVPSPVLHSTGRATLHPALLLLPGFPLPTLHGAENLLGLALAEPPARLLGAGGWRRRRRRSPTGGRLPCSTTTAV